jgi:hypothetical protein
VVPTHTGFERLGLFFQQQEAIENEKDEQGSSSEQ